MDSDPRPPLTRDAVRERYHAHHDHVRSTLPEAVWIGFQGAVLGGFGLGAEATWARVVSVAGGVLLVGAAIGLVRAAEGARVTAGLALVLAGAAGLALPYLLAREEPQLSADEATFGIVQLATGVYLLLPATRATFQRARAARERARETRAGTRGARQGSGRTRG